MAYKLLESQEARTDVRDIVRYMAVDLDNRSAAVDFLDALDAAYGNVTKQPFMYTQCVEGQLRALGSRKIVIKHYVILYRVDEEMEAVLIQRVFYMRRNYAALI